MKKLVVIGNGFDIAHGLPTKYSDFMKYLFSKNKLIYDALKKYIPKEELWNSFEEALGNLNYNKLLDEKQINLKYYDQNKSHFDYDDYDFQNNIKKDLCFYPRILDYFHEWIKNINTNILPIMPLEIINKSCKFLNFNYTNTLEVVYGIDHDNILYIHGEGSISDEIILGHQSNNWTNIKSQSVDFRIREGSKIIIEYFKKTFKNTKEIIEKNRLYFNKLSSIDEIYILGHSLSLIDLDYFIEIQKHVSPHCEWYITWYDEKTDFQKAEIFIEKLKLEKYKLIDFNSIKNN